MTDYSKDKWYIDRLSELNRNTIDLDENLFNGEIIDVATIFLKYGKTKSFERIFHYYRDLYNRKYKIQELELNLEWEIEALDNFERYDGGEMVASLDDVILGTYGDAMLDELNDEEKIILGVDDVEVR